MIGVDGIAVPFDGSVADDRNATDATMAHSNTNGITIAIKTGYDRVDGAGAECALLSAGRRCANGEFGPAGTIAHGIGWWGT